MSKEIGQGDHSGNVDSRVISAHSTDKSLSPVPFADVGKEVDNVQATILSENEEENSVKTPESKEEKDTEEDINTDYLHTQPEFTEEKLIDITQVHNDDISPDQGNPSATPVESTEEKLPDSGLLTTNEDRGDRVTSQQSASREARLPCGDGDAPSQHDRDTPDSKTSLVHGRSDSAYTPSDEEYTLLLEQLNEERVNAIEHNKRLQMKLAPVLAKKTKEELERVLQGPMQMESFERCLEVLTELKEKMKEDEAAAEREMETLRVQAEERLSKVDKEWQDLLSLKRDVALTVLSRRMAKPHALARVESALASEQMYQDELTKVRLHNFSLENRIRRLKRAISEADRHATNPFQREYEKLHAKRTERKKYVEKQTEEALRVQKNVVRKLQTLSDTKRKIHCIETEIQHKSNELAQVDLIMAQKREKLAGIKQSHSRLQRDNMKLKEKCGLMGNEVLLRDYSHTIKANAILEERLKNLKYRHADFQFSLGRGRKRLEAI